MDKTGLLAAAIATDGLIIAIGLIADALARHCGVSRVLVRDLRRALKVIRAMKSGAPKHVVAQQALNEVLRLLESRTAPTQARRESGR